MKTYFKGFKTVTIIFLSLVLFTCQYEEIEPIDTLSTDSDQILLKPGKGERNVVYFYVDLNRNDLSGNNVLESDPLLCQGVSSSKQTLLWFSEGCRVSFNTGVNDLSLQSIRPGVGSTEYTVFMGDGAGGDFRAWFDGTDLVKLDFNPHSAYPLIQEPIDVFKKEGKGKHKVWVPTGGTIQIGEIVLTPTPTKPM